MNWKKISMILPIFSFLLLSPSFIFSQDNLQPTIKVSLEASGYLPEKNEVTIKTITIPLDDFDTLKLKFTHSGGDRILTR